MKSFFFSVYKLFSSYSRELPTGKWNEELRTFEIKPSDLILDSTKLHNETEKASVSDDGGSDDSVAHSVSSSRKRVIILSSSEDEIIEVVQESLASETVAVKEPVSVRGRDRVRSELIAQSQEQIEAHPEVDRILPNRSLL
jgi:hypothetical protein